MMVNCCSTFSSGQVRSSLIDQHNDVHVTFTFFKEHVQTAGTTGVGTDRSHLEVSLPHRDTERGELGHPPHLGGCERWTWSVDTRLAAGSGAGLHISCAHILALHHDRGRYGGVTIPTSLSVPSLGEQFESEADEDSQDRETNTKTSQCGQVISVCF